MEKGINCILEYLEITKFLIKSGKVPVEKGFILVTKDVLVQLLSRNGNETVENKLKIWNRLRWIDAEPGRYTKKVSRNGSSKRYVKIDENIYLTNNELFGKQK
jgi:DNA primase large subunit